jgi:hypothetical protein
MKVKIPKIVHFIWIGNDIPHRNRECIATFPKKNPDWECWLWIDANQLLVGERRRLVKEHYEKIDSNIFHSNIFHRGGPSTKTTLKRQGRMEKRVGRYGDDLGPEDEATIEFITKYLRRRGEEWDETREAKLKSIRKFCKGKKIKLRTVQKDLDMGQSITGIYRQELAGRGTNFGAASDVLRVEILLKYGGVYFDTDVNCVHKLGTIRCHDDHPRFSAVSTVWHKKPPTRTQWQSDEWWKNSVLAQDPPPISNSIIACRPHCEGLKKYKMLIKSNYRALQADAELQTEYLNDFRGSTIRMTGPSAATEGSGLGDVQKTKGTYRAGMNDATVLKDKLFMRDNWYFPMYMVEDQYFHDWLPQ